MLRRSTTFFCQQQQQKRIVRVGDSYSVKRIFTKQDVETYSKLCGDNNPIHLDEAAAKKAGFETCIVHGALVSSLFSYILGVHIPGPGSIYLNQTVNFQAPVLVGEEVEAKITVSKFRKEKGLILHDTIVTRVRDGKTAIRGTSLGMNKIVSLEGDTPSW